MSGKSTLRLGASTEDGEVARVANENRECIGFTRMKVQEKDMKEK